MSIVASRLYPLFFVAMSINPISKITYYTPNETPEAGLSEFFAIVWSKIKDRYQKEKLELRTWSNKALLEVVFKSGSKRQFDICFLRKIKHAIESILLGDLSEEDLDDLQVIVI